MTVYSGDIGNTFGPKGIVDRFEPAGLIVEIPQIVVHEGDEPDPLADLRHADILPRKHVAEIHFLAFEADPAAVSPTLKKRRNLDGWSTGGPAHGEPRRFFCVSSASRLR